MMGLRFESLVQSFRICGFGFRLFDFGFRIYGLGFRIFCLWFRIEFEGVLRVKGLGLHFQFVGMEFRACNGNSLEPQTPKPQAQRLNRMDERKIDASVVSRKLSQRL